MRILMVSFGDLSGGANRSAYRVHRALVAAGVASTMAVVRKTSQDPTVHEMEPHEIGLLRRGRGSLDRVPKAFLMHGSEPISLGIQGVRIDRLVHRFRPDLVHLHWVNGGTVSIASIATMTVPVVWTFHDMWAFTGGCHYVGDCEGYVNACDACPKVRDLAVVRGMPAWVHARKSRLWRDRPMYVIAPSQWMAKMARRSSLFSDSVIETIGYCVDPAVFNPSERSAVRQQFGLAADERCLLFVNADQPRKGASIIGEAMRRLRSTGSTDKLRFLFAGGLPEGVRRDDEGVRLLPATHEESVMAGYYAAADLFALPSYEDNLPNAIIESLACGTPVVAFPAGGIPEMVRQGENGALTKEFDSNSLADALEASANTSYLQRAVISQQAHATYSRTAIADSHLRFYRNMVRSDLKVEGTN